MDLKVAKMEVKEIKTKEMTKLQRFSEVKSGKINFSGGLCFCDWLEFSIKGDLDFDVLDLLKIRDEVKDKKSQTYKHIIEFKDFTIMYGFYGSSSTSDRVHIKLSNEFLYKHYEDVKSPYSFYNDYLRGFFHYVDMEHSYIHRVDIAFDVLENSLNYDKILFSIKNNTFQNPINGERKQVLKYREFFDYDYLGGKSFKNYAVGSRSSDVFIRFYNKTVENFDRSTHKSKKSYISYYHDKLREDFSNSDKHVYRLEFECKFENMPITLQSFDSLGRSLINDYLRECDYSEALTIKTKPIKYDFPTDRFCYLLLSKLEKYTRQFPASLDVSVSTLMKCLKSHVVDDLSFSTNEFMINGFLK